MDKFSKETRSEIMSHIHRADTKPELKVRSAMHHLGYRFRKNDKRYPGTPDIYFPKYKVAVFVNGCFWHGHENCKYFKMPKSNVEFWENKINRNRARDNRKIHDLTELDILSVTIWECEINKDIMPPIVKTGFSKP